MPAPHRLDFASELRHDRQRLSFQPLPSFLKPVAGIPNRDPARQFQAGLKLIF